MQFKQIGEIAGWTHTRVNGWLVEGRARLRELSTG
jgi:hypothetical protein